MISEDSFQYAIENTEVLRAPEGRIATFGGTRFRFFLISELMDRTGEIRVRDGRLHAERPQVIAPGHYARLMLDGFGDEAREFADWLERHGRNLAMLKYGFQLRKTEVRERIIQSPLAAVVDQVNRDVDRLEDPLSAVIQGVDDAWEVCLLKFTVDLIQRSAGGNFGDLRGSGLL